MKFANTCEEYVLNELEKARNDVIFPIEALAPSEGIVPTFWSERCKASRYSAFLRLRITIIGHP